MNGLKRAAPKLPGNGVQAGAPPAKINPVVKQISLLNQVPVPVPVSLIGSLSDKARQVSLDFYSILLCVFRMSPLDLSKRKDEKEDGLEEKNNDKLETLPLFVKKDTESPQPSTSGTHKVVESLYQIRKDNLFNSRILPPTWRSRSFALVELPSLSMQLSKHINNSTARMWRGLMMERSRLERYDI